jgi:hypothetical protein
VRMRSIRGAPPTSLWTPALDRHGVIVDRAPDLAVGRPRLFSAANEAAAHARGIRRVVLPGVRAQDRGPTQPRTRAVVWSRGALAGRLRGTAARDALVC